MSGNDRSPDELSEDFPEPVPPQPSRVAARALVLAAACCRMFIEKDAGDPGAEELRMQILPWLEKLGVLEELETRELDWITTPLGNLDRKVVVNGTWLIEGLVVLAWALGKQELPAFAEQCDPAALANQLGFLADRTEETVLGSPYLVAMEQIESWADAYLTLHWRLREFRLNPVRIDLTAYVEACTWGPLSLEKLELQEGDLAIDGRGIETLTPQELQNLTSITQERHQALNWLLGWDEIYSEVTTDT